LRKSLRAQQFEERPRFPAGNNKPVQAIEMRRIADEHDLRTELFEAGAVGVEIALQRQNSDFHAGLILTEGALIAAALDVSPLGGC